MTFILLHSYLACYWDMLIYSCYLFSSSNQGERRTKRKICFKKYNENLKESRNHGDDLMEFIRNMNEKHCSSQ